MDLQVKQRSCQSRRCTSPANDRRRRMFADEGYILLIMMMMATLLLISLAAAVPSIYVEGKREKEKELIFRGEQYARAIELFHMKFHRYPASIKELLHTDNLSFLRQRFRDPMVKNGKWRYIYATANGVILNSKILGPPGKKGTLMGGSKSTSQSSSGNSQSSSQSGFHMGNFSLPGSSSSSGFGSGSGSNASNDQQGKNSSSFFGNGKKMLGVYIVGVASTSHAHSIRVFEHRTQYDEWEFLGIPGAPGAPNLGAQAVVPAGKASPSSPFSKPSSGGFHLGPSQPSPGARPGSMFGGSSN